MARQTTKTNRLFTSSVALQSVDETRYFDATLQGSGLAATAHTRLTRINSVFSGDTLTARGSNNTLTGGAGNDLLVSSGNNNLLVASAGSDTLVSGNNGATFAITNAAQFATASISGGAGIDTLRVGVAAKVSDAQFARAKGIDVVALTGSSSVTLGSLAGVAGVKNVQAGAGNTSLVQTAEFVGPVTLTGGVGRDLISVASASQLAANSISGGDGEDTLSVSSPASLNGSFSRVNGVEVLSLNGASAVTLDGSSTFTTVVAGSITQTAANNRAVRMVGTAQNDSFAVANSTLLANDTIAAGSGRDTLTVGQSPTLTDGNFTNISGVEVLSLVGSSSVTLDKDATKSGITTILGSSSEALSVSVTAGNTARLSIEGGAQGDSFALASTQMLSRNTISGGGGNDTLSIAAAGVISDRQFANIRDVEMLSLSGASSVTLDSVAGGSGIRNVQGGSDNDRFAVGSGFTTPLTLAGGAGNDLFAVASGSQLETISVSGGDGTDTLAVGGAYTFNDATLSGIEVVSLSGAATVTLGANAKASGISTILGGRTDSSFTLSEGGFAVTGGAGNDAFSLASASLLGSASLSGGRGIDTLAISGNLNIGDSFENISGIEVLSLTGTASATLGENASQAGIRQVIAGNGGASLTQVENYLNLNITGGTGNDFFSIENGIMLAKDTIDGVSGNDTLEIATASVLLDRSFAKVQNTGVLLLSDDGYYVGLGSLAGEAGISTIVGKGSNDTINAARFEGDTEPLVLDFSESGGDNLLIGSNAATNLFLIGGNDALESTTLKGGGATDGDTLTIVGEDEEITDEALANVRGIEVLAVKGAASIELGLNAAASGLATIYGGEGDMTITQSAGAFDIQGGAASSNLVQFAVAALGEDSTLTGGDGEDTISVTAPGDIDDAFFQNKTSFEVLQLTGDSQVTLGENAASDDLGLTSLIAGEDAVTTFIHTEDAGKAFTLDGSAGSSNLFAVASGELAQEDVIIGSGNSDTLSVGGAEVVDDAFSNVTDVAVLHLSGDEEGNAAVTLDSLAESAEFATVVGSSGAMTFTQIAGGYVLDGSQGESNLFDIATIDLAAGNESMIGGSGIDTLVLSEEGEIDGGEVLANVSGVEVLSLTGSSSLTLDSVPGNQGLASVYGGEGDMTVTLEGGSYHINGSASSTILVNLTESSLLGGNTILGGDGEDTLTIAGESVLEDADFLNLKDVEILALEGGGSVLLGDSAAETGLATIFGGADGETSIVQTAGSYHFEALGEGAMQVRIENASLAGEDTFIGNGETSTLAFGEGVIEDDAFTNVSGVGNVVLEGSSSISLEEAASDASSGLMTVFGGSGDSTFNQTAGSYVLDGSASSSNLFNVASGILVAGTTIVGGDGEDVLSITEEDTLIGDAAFANVSGVEVLSLSGGSSVTLGANAATAEFTSVITGDGASVINFISGSPDVIEVNGQASESLLVNFESASLVGDNSLYGGEGDDTLSIGGDSQIDDEVFANIQSVGVLSLSGASSVTLGANAAAAYLDTIYGGIGNSTIIQDADNANLLKIDAQGGNDLIVLDSALYLLNNTISGGEGNNTLVVNSAGDLTDDYFENNDSLGTLSLAGGSSVILGSNAVSAGIEKVIMGEGSNSFTLNEDAESAVYLDGSEGTNLFRFDNDSQLADATIKGGSDDDTLSLANEASMGDALFTNVDSVEVLELSGSSEVALGGALLDRAGISTVIGGTGSSTFTQDALSVNSYYIDASAGTDNLFSLGYSSQMEGNTIIGGLGSDTLEIGNQDSIEDTAFSNVRSVSVLQLTGSSDVVLGMKADESGISTVVGGSGNSTFTHGELSENSYFFDAGSGSNNLFVLEKVNQLLVDTLEGGSTGADTLQVGQGSIDDSDFARVGGIEVLQLTGSSDVILGDKADTAGFATIIGGSGSSTITHASENFRSLLIDGSDGSDNLFVIGDVNSVALDTILGGTNSTGVDTLQVAEGSMLDSHFTNIDDVEVLQLTGSSDVILGDKADTAGITKVYSGEGATTINQTAENFKAMLMDGTAASSNRFVIGSVNAIGQDTITGGSGIDTLEIGSGALVDADFSNVNGVEVLQLTGLADVTLGSAAQGADIASVFAGTAATSIDASAYTASILLDASSNTDGALLIAGSNADTLNGGSGADTLQGWATTGNGASDTLFGGTGADLFVLGNASSNAYDSESNALISDFEGGIDFLQLKDYEGSGAASYRVDTVTAGSGYTHQLFDISGGGSGLLLANINYSGSGINAQDDLLGTKAIFA